MTRWKVKFVCQYRSCKNCVANSNNHNNNIKLVMIYLLNKNRFLRTHCYSQKILKNVRPIISHYTPEIRLSMVKYIIELDTTCELVFDLLLLLLKSEIPRSLVLILFAKCWKEMLIIRRLMTRLSKITYFVAF